MADREPQIRNGKVLALNVNVPGDESPVDARKYHEMRRALLEVLPETSPGLTHKEMIGAVKPVLDDEIFPGGRTVGWWSKSVQLDLEARGLMARSNTKPLRWYALN